LPYNFIYIFFICTVRAVFTSSDYSFSLNASSTSATVTTDGATVYRIFNYVPFKLGTNVSASDYTGSYDANAHGISVSTTISGATIKYGTTAGTYNLTANPTYKNVGTYTVYYQISKTGYTTITGSQKVTITKATNNKLTLSDTSESVRHPDTTKYNVTISQTFDGALSISNISDSSVANVTLSGNTLTLTNKGVDGTVTVTVKAAGTDNFNEATATLKLSNGFVQDYDKIQYLKESNSDFERVFDEISGQLFTNSRKIVR